jgi:hypothetical protein
VGFAISAVLLMMRAQGHYTTTMNIPFLKQFRPSLLIDSLMANPWLYVLGIAPFCIVVALVVVCPVVECLAVVCQWVDQVCFNKRNMIYNGREVYRFPVFFTFNIIFYLSVCNNNYCNYERS